jgi:hypothetical protein
MTIPFCSGIPCGETNRTSLEKILQLRKGNTIIGKAEKGTQ